MGTALALTRMRGSAKSTILAFPPRHRLMAHRHRILGDLLLVAAFLIPTFK
jgi:hypothetical protein